MQQLLRVLVEGGDDAHFVQHFIKKAVGLNLRIEREIVNLRSIEPLLAELVTYGNGSQSGYDALAVICDADSDPAQRWHDVRLGLGLPEESKALGRVDAFVRDTRVGVWLMPDNQSPGGLEAFLSRIKRSNAPQAALWNKAVSAVTDLLPEERLFAQKDLSKAELRTWLAWQREPGAPYGLAVNQDCFDLDHPLAQSFAHWIRLLLQPPPIS